MRRDDRFFKSVMKISRAKRQITMLVTVGTSAELSLRSQVGMGSESDCLLGQLNRILEISDSEALLKWRSQCVLLEKKVSVEMLM